LTFCTEKNKNVGIDGNGNGNGNGDGNGETEVPIPVKPEIYDVQNLSSDPLMVVDNPDSDVFIPMDLVSTSKPVEGVPNSPVHTTMDFGVYIQQEAVQPKEESSTEGN